MFSFSGSLGDEQLPYAHRGFSGDFGQVRQAVEHIIVGAVVMALEHHRVGFRGIRRFTGMDKPMVSVSRLSKSEIVIYSIFIVIQDYHVRPTREVTRRWQE
jgi:hypothetical protein